MIEGLSHITLIVKDLERATHFITSVFEAKEVYSSGDNTFSISKEKYFDINGIWLAIMEGTPPSEKSYSHIALKVSESDFDMYVDRMESFGIEILEGRDRIEGEGRSIYFYDYDNHLFELHTGTLDQRLKIYQK
jgi:catechol 2,3-dioxygenase-like lactoylglutathione lyase family enzyme